jgi:hypothetical protein
VIQIVDITDEVGDAVEDEAQMDYAIQVQGNVENNPYAIVPYKSSLLITLLKEKFLTVQVTENLDDNNYGMPPSMMSNLATLSESYSSDKDSNVHEQEEPGRIIHTCC